MNDGMAGPAPILREVPRVAAPDRDGAGDASQRHLPVLACAQRARPRHDRSCVGPRSRYAGRRQPARALGAVGNCRVPRPHLALLQSRVIQPGPRFCVPDGMVGGPARRRGAARDHRVSRRAHGHRLFRLQGPAHSSADADVAPDHQRAEARTEDHLLPSQPSPGRPLAQPARRVQPRHRRISLVFVHSRFLPLYAIG